jgi:hypothetical protein
MTELTTLLNDVHTNLETKIKELYETKLKEHTENISCKLSDAYTRAYGKIISYPDAKANIIINKLSQIMFNYNNNFYIIHSVSINVANPPVYSCDNSYKMVIIDNYGNITLGYYRYRPAGCEDPQPYHDSFCPKNKTYVCPDMLIDLIKGFIFDYSINDKYLDSISKKIQLLAEDYYNRFMIDKPLIYENKKLIEENENIKKSLIKITNEVGCQTETFNDDIKVIIENNVLTIFYYNNDELNLCDYLPKLTKDIEKDGRTITINYTDIERVSIICSDFKKITKYYQGIKHIQLFNCKNFERIPHYLKKDLLFFTNDGKNLLKNNDPPSYNN